MFFTWCVIFLIGLGIHQQVVTKNELKFLGKPSTNHQGFYSPYRRSPMHGIVPLIYHEMGRRWREKFQKVICLEIHVQRRPVMWLTIRPYGKDPEMDIIPRGLLMQGVLKPNLGKLIEPTSYVWINVISKLQIKADRWCRWKKGKGFQDGKSEHRMKRSSHTAIITKPRRRFSRASFGW